jgi:hypothetical protein
MTLARKQDSSSDDTKSTQVQRHCTASRAFGNASSHPGLRFVVFEDDIRTSEPTFSDMRVEEVVVPWSKAA